MSASRAATPPVPRDAMTPATASPRIDPSTPITHAIINAREKNQPAFRIAFIDRPPSRILRPFPLPFSVYSQKSAERTRWIRPCFDQPKVFKLWDHLSCISYAVFCLKKKKKDHTL